MQVAWKLRNTKNRQKGMFFFGIFRNQQKCMLEVFTIKTATLEEILDTFKFN